MATAEPTTESIVSIENANKITIELLVHGYLRLHVFPWCASSDIPLKVFNILLSTVICTDIKTCSVLSRCLDILKQYDEWVNTDKKSKSSFVCNIPYHASPLELISTYFDHISNLHGLTYNDYDKLNAYCKSAVYNTLSAGSATSVLNECLSSSCLILNEEQKQELEKLTHSSHHTTIESRSLDTLFTEDYTLYTNYESTLTKAPLNQQKSVEFESEVIYDDDEAADHFPEDLSFKKHFKKQSSFGSRSISTVTQLLTPSWTAVRNKWQSGGDVSHFISQISVLSLLPTISDVDPALEHDTDNEDDDHNIDHIDKADRSGIILPPTPDSPTLGISMKSYRFIFDAINPKEDSMNIGYRQIAEMSINPFDLLPTMSEPIPTDSDVDVDVNLKKKSKKYEYELRTQLQNILNEMDLMGEGRLDLADLSTALTSVIKDLDYDLMSISMKIFEDDKLSKDDMDSAAIEDIITYIVDNMDDDIVNLRQTICDGLDINYDEEEEEEEVKDEELTSLVLADKEETDEPYKPLYAVTTGIQRFGNTTNVNKKKEESNNKDNKDNGSDLQKLKIIKSVKDEAFADVLDKIHIYLFHAVHDIKKIPL